ncbi:MAG: hypothetical protein JWR69_2072 [Pedosphaera sp.]|nr:hypothetical protein [Pedosphaera sp.]
MNCLLPYNRMLVLAGLLLGNLFSGTGARADTSLSADEVVRRAVQRAESPETRSARPDYGYRKHTITEELDKKGRLKEHKEKLYDVLVESGLSSLKLVQLNGQNLPPAELKKQEEHDAAERAKIADTKPDKKGDGRENVLTADLVGRFKFTLLEQKLINDRLTYVLSFEPKSADLPIVKLTDRFVNHMAGTVWIDAQEFEIAKADIHLQNEISLWGGIVGTLRRCDFTLLRTRLPDGVWFNSFSHGIFEGRKLFEPMLIKTMSESSGFHRLALAKD